MKWDCTGTDFFSNIYRNDMIAWLSLELRWIIKTYDLCGANFLFFIYLFFFLKDNTLHDDNERRSQGGRTCLRCFIALRLSSGFLSSVLARLQRRSRIWMHRERRTVMSYMMDALQWHATCISLKYLNVFYRNCVLKVVFKILIMEILTSGFFCLRF